jgi:hypothetical protein
MVAKSTPLRNSRGLPTHGGTGARGVSVCVIEVNVDIDNLWRERWGRRRRSILDG